MNTLLLIVAYLIDAVFTVPLTIIKSIQNRKRLDSYHFNVALHYDYKWCSQLFYGYDGHSVSAVIFKRAYVDKNHKYVKYVKFVNWVFRDVMHCRNAYTKEFVEN